MTQKHVKNVLFFAGFPILLIAPWFIIGLPIWGYMMCVIVLVILLTEAISKIIYKKSISGAFLALLYGES